MTSALSPTNSAARRGNRSGLPSPHRYSIAMFWPCTYPRSRNPSRNAVSQEDMREEVAVPRRPTRGTFPDVCASPAMGAAKRLPETIPRKVRRFMARAGARSPGGAPGSSDAWRPGSPGPNIGHCNIAGEGSAGSSGRSGTAGKLPRLLEQAHVRLLGRPGTGMQRWAPSPLQRRRYPGCGARMPPPRRPIGGTQAAGA